MISPHQQPSDAIDGRPLAIPIIKPARERDWLFVASRDHKPVPFASILREVSAQFGVAQIDIVSHRRTVVIAKPRHAVCYLARHLTLLSLPCIGRLLGGRDHTTILASVQRAELLIASERHFAAQVSHLRGKLLGLS